MNLKRIFILIFFILFFTSCSDIELDDPTYLKESDFEDPALAVAVHQSLGTWQSLNNFYAEGVISLRMESMNITNLSGMEIFTNLIYLRIDNNMISDITPLSSLTELYTVYLSNNLIMDISPLASQIDVRILFLSNNNIQAGVTELSALTNLKYLDLYGNNNIKYTDLQSLQTSLPDTTIILPDVWIPETPANVNASPGNAAVTLNWDISAGADFYRIYWSTSTGVDTDSELIPADITGVNYEHTGLTNGTTYYYKITAGKNGSSQSNESVLSSEVSATPTGL